ncbi:MAG: type IV secretion protein Rhs, partial [Rothia mucilaginosa]|nr:type IV secretion protein Rhs [Rothia mucilaginosa]
VGAGWGADPFSLVGGNPVSLVDPWGLSPVSVEDFEKQARPSGIAGWVRNNWEYVAGGAMVLAGTVIGVIGAGAGPFGGAVLGGISGALMGAGMSVIEQKMSGGKVDWSKVKDEGIKAGISGAVTGLVTGGLGNLKKLADGVTKVTEVAEKVSWLTKMKQATSAVASKATAPFKPFGKNLGAFMKDSKVFEDVIKDSLSGGINNVISYYRDDNIKDKNLSGAFTMFTFGAGTAAVGAKVSGVAKTRFGVKGYAPEPDYSSLPKHIQKEIQKSQEGFWPRTVAKSKNVFLNAGIDATVGAGKNGVQYISELPIKKQEFSGKDMMDKIVGGFSKDFIKSTLKGSMKISDERADGFRHSPVTTTRKTASELRNGFKENVSNGYDWTMVRVLSWVI